MLLFLGLAGITSILKIGGRIKPLLKISNMKNYKIVFYLFLAIPLWAKAEIDTSLAALVHAKNQEQHHQRYIPFGVMEPELAAESLKNSMVKKDVWIDTDLGRV